MKRREMLINTIGSLLGAKTLVIPQELPSEFYSWRTGLCTDRSVPSPIPRGLERWKVWLNDTEVDCKTMMIYEIISGRKGYLKYSESYVNEDGERRVRITRDGTITHVVYGSVRVEYQPPRVR